MYGRERVSGEPWRIEIHQHGPCGRIDYLEESHTLSVYWEFGGRDVVAIITSSARNDGEWDGKYPWAAGRQQEVMNRIGSETVRQKAPTCVIDFDARSPWCIRVREPRFPSGR